MRVTGPCEADGRDVAKMEERGNAEDKTGKAKERERKQHRETRLS